jgi:hypothetical protein
MAVSFQPITLDGNAPDSEAMLVYRNERLLAVLVCLSDIHGELTGQWYVEANFGEMPVVHPPAFETIEQFTKWLA